MVARCRRGAQINPIFELGNRKKVGVIAAPVTSPAYLHIKYASPHCIAAAFPEKFALLSLESGSFEPAFPLRLVVGTMRQS